MLKMLRYITLIQFGEKLMRGKYALICILMLVLVPFFATTVSAQPDPSAYAPIFYFEGEETCYPVDAQYHIDNSDLVNISVDMGLTLEVYDNINGGIDDDGIINHYQSMRSTYGDTVYYRIYSTGITDVIQYWMFYAFNEGDLNQHEGDWEMVQITFVNDQPESVAYSQHHSGQTATWAQVEKDGNHIKVYVARGSHANYLRSFSGKLGIASDVVGANGEVLSYNDYALYDAEAQTWIDFEGRWGAVPTDTADAAAAQILGQNGPEGPKYRMTFTGTSLWDDPEEWASGLLPANDMFFTAEWFMYNFVTIFVLITLAIVGLLIFKIYRRHKKYGLGPRFVSILYIDGLNLHSIGNILCIVGIILAIFGLFSPWYNVSYDVTGSGALEFETEGLVDILSLDGVTGLHITIPGTSGPVPMGSFDMPIYLFLLVGIILMIIATIGLPLSKKLGFKYIFRGIRLFSPLILIMIFVIALSSIVPALAGAGGFTEYLQQIMSPITSSPFGGATSVTIPLGVTPILVDVQWGLGSGIWYLIIAAIILIIAGILMIMSKKQFFATKMPLPGQAPIPAPMKPSVPPPAKPKKTKGSKKGKPKAAFCDECGEKLEANAEFCVKCGKKFGK
jgi:hypothetical protein